MIIARKNIFSGNYHVKVGHFSGKYQMLLVCP